ncbi:MAG: amino acid ABC transporter ATP-binding protein [Paludibacteraceae bacterium]|nr:amino acid ABC transporter ATP-binding protein [Paludibacteraceae bacterium]
MFYTRKGEADILTKEQRDKVPSTQPSTTWLWISGFPLLLTAGGLWIVLRRKRNLTAKSSFNFRLSTFDSNSPLISVSHLSKSFGSLHVLRDISLEVRPGEVISVIGPSGTGKSTFLRCLNLLEQPSGGTIRIDGQDILSPDADVPLLRRRMGMVFQSFNLFNDKSVLDNITMSPILLLGKSREEAEQQAHRLLEMVGLAERADAMPDELSGGQKQRVAIARALAMEPEILLFDEPTSALDPTMVSEVLGVITRLAREGMTMIIVTHEMRFAHQVSSRVLFFAEGVIYEEGTPEQLFQHPQRTLTQRFIRQIHETEFTIRSEHFDWYAMMAQMEQFCRQYNLSRQRTENVYRAVDESLAILGTPVGTCLTLSYTEQDDSLLLTVRTPHLIPPDALDMEDNMLAVAILRSVSTDIRIESNACTIAIR